MAKFRPLWERPGQTTLWSSGKNGNKKGNKGNEKDC